MFMILSILLNDSSSRVSEPHPRSQPFFDLPDWVSSCAPTALSPCPPGQTHGRRKIKWGSGSFLHTERSV